MIYRLAFNRDTYDKLCSVSGIILADEPRGNGVMDLALAYCAGGLGSISAIGKSKYSNVFSPSRPKAVGRKMEPDTRNCMS